jgi:hypothetical protein
MALQLSVTARNGRLDAIETAIGTAAKLQIWSGSMPANCAAAATGTKLLEDTLDSDWAAAAASGSKSMQKGGSAVSGANPYAGTGLAGAGSGTAAGYFRIVDSAGTTCHLQGTVGTSGTDMTIDNASIASGQTVNITGFTLTDGNA